MIRTVSPFDRFHGRPNADIRTTEWRDHRAKPRSFAQGAVSAASAFNRARWVRALPRWILGLNSAVRLGVRRSRRNRVLAMNNLLLEADSYKAAHARAYPPGMTSMYSYLESRGGAFPATVFFGLRYYLEAYLAAGFARKDIGEAREFWEAHLGRKDVFDVELWRRLYERHGGGLPLKIMAVPEGTLVPTGNVLMTIENTDPEFAFLTSWVETLLMKVWYPTTVATQSWHIRQTIRNEYERTGANPAGLDFACHDFGYRGVSSEESARLGAAAHLLSFRGTDTVAGIRMLQDHYDAGMPGFSIPATEHSVIMAFGPDGEAEAFAHYLRTYPTGVIACVSDTYDIFNAAANLWGGVFRDEILARDGKLVIRPDSGDPLKVVPRVLGILGEKFSLTVNAQGYKVLDPHVGVIQGDGMNPDSIRALYARIREAGWSAENLAVGSGGALLQTVNRDTCQFAIKASQVIVNGETIDIAKSPVTDVGKRSKRGRLKLLQNERGELATLSSHDGAERFERADDCLATVFENGRIVLAEPFEEIRARLMTNEPSLDASVSIER
jgi:nicotinamide phosphoribosyltransferase